MKRFLFTLLFIFFYAGFTQAAAPENVTAPPKADTPIPEKVPDKNIDQVLKERNIGKESLTRDVSYWKEFMNMLMVLAGIVLVLLFAGWFLKRILRTRMAQMNFSSHIKIIDKRALHPKACLYLLEVDGKRVLIGEGQNHMAILSEMEGSEACDEEKKKKGKTSFSSLLRSQISKKQEDES